MALIARKTRLAVRRTLWAIAAAISIPAGAIADDAEVFAVHGHDCTNASEAEDHDCDESPVSEADNRGGVDRSSELLETVADQGLEAGLEVAREYIETLRIAMFCVGARRPAELRGRVEVRVD